MKKKAKRRISVPSTALLVCEYCGAEGELKPPLQPDEIRIVRCGNPACRMTVAFHQTNSPICVKTNADPRTPLCDPLEQQRQGQ